MIQNDLETILLNTERELVAGSGFLTPDGNEELEKKRKTYMSALKQYLDSNYARIRDLHANGASGIESVRGFTSFIDVLLKHIFRVATEEAKRKGFSMGRCVLVALGGYGRGELNPSSDVDLMIVFKKKQDKFVQMMAQKIFYTLWDTGINVGHSVRSLEDCISLAKEDLISRTSMMESRYIIGDRRLYREFQDKLKGYFYKKKFDTFLTATISEQERRFRKYGNTVFLQEPNIKEGMGGLRDLHTAMWLVWSKFGARTLMELEDKELITQIEHKNCDEALKFLWRVRNELHFICGRKNDVLSLDLQQTMSKSLGYKNDEYSLAVEQFMRDYYINANFLHRFSQRVIRLCRRHISRREAVMKRLMQKHIGDGLVIYDGLIHLAKKERDIFGEEPSRLIKIFLNVQKYGCELGEDVQRAVEERLELINDDFRLSESVRKIFFEILRGWGKVAKTLRLIHELGVLGKYIPEFGRLTCLVQYDFYHKYTADEHTFIAIEYLESITPGNRPEMEEMSRLISEIEKPEILMLALILHDIGKAFGHEHTRKGAQIISDVTERLKLDSKDKETVDFLVSNHLLMAHMAQRRDLDDPKTVIEIAREVKTLERLKMLYLITYADTRAVGPNIWTEWKRTLLWELYLKTYKFLTYGIPEKEVQDREIEMLYQKVSSELKGEIFLEAVQKHFSDMSIRYLLSTPSQKIANHLRLIERIIEKNELVTTDLAHHSSIGYTEFTVASRDDPGLFSSIAGTLAANKINILSAQIYTRKDGIAIDAFQVNDPQGFAVEDSKIWETVRDELVGIFSGQKKVDDLFPKDSRPQELIKLRSQKGRTKISFDNNISDTHTVIDVKAQDQLGLLYIITKTLSEGGMDISLSKITTEVDEALDVFYVTDRMGNKLTDEEDISKLQGALLNALEPD